MSLTKEQAAIMVLQGQRDRATDAEAERSIDLMLARQEIESLKAEIAELKNPAKPKARK